MVTYLLAFTSIGFGAQYRVPDKPCSVTVADINLDGHPDILIGHTLNSGWRGISILMNDGAGNFKLVDSIYLNASQVGVQAANIDMDPRPEIFGLTYDTTRSNEYLVVIWNANPDSISLFPLNRTDLIDGFLIDDLNHDGRTDVIIWSNQGRFWGILYGDGHGGFSLPVYYDLGFPPISLAVGDLNGNGRDDIVMPSSTSSMLMYINSVSGFDTISIATTPMLMGDIKVADMNNDGHNEIVVVQNGSMVSPSSILVYSRNSSGNFVLTETSPPIKEAVAHLCISDVNGDGFNDVIFNSSPWTPHSDYELFHTYLLINNGNGTFQPPVSYYTGICSCTSFTSDLNGDGRVDLITLNYDFYNPPPDSCSISLLMNNGVGGFIVDTPANPFWTHLTELGGNAIYAIAVKPGGIVAAGTGNALCVSTNNGLSWTRTNEAAGISALVVDQGGKIYAGSSGSGVFCSSDNGGSWEYLGPSLHWVSTLSRDDRGDVIAGCTFGGIFISSDGGNHWLAKDSGLTSMSIASLAVGVNGDFFAGTANGVFRSSDFGNTWVQANTGLSDSTINCIAVRSDGSISCGTANALYSSTNNGDAWAKGDLPKNNVTSILPLGAEELFVGTFNRGVYHTTNGGASWAQINGGFLYASIVSLALDSTGYLLAGSMGGQMYRSVSIVTAIGNGKTSLPTKYLLYQNFPNPFNPSTTIRYFVPHRSRITLSLYNTLGQLVTNLVNGTEEAGSHSVKFDGARLASGVYFYQLRVGNFVLTKSLVLLR